MELRRYQGPLFDGERPHPGLGSLLAARDALVEVGSGPAPRVALGVPHHAAVGVDRIAERRPEGGRVADANAVLYGLACLEQLAGSGVACRLLVAAHASDHDPNKRPGSPYCTWMLSQSRLELLIECHGAGRRAPHDLELSAGRNPHAEPLRFGRLLARSLGPGFRLAVQTRPGVRSARLLCGTAEETRGAQLRFPALRTHSLAAVARRGVAALHLEAKPRFRSRGDGSDAVTPSGRLLGRSLAAAVLASLRPAPSRCGPGG